MIGGGVIGVACAHYLIRAGWRVTLVDRGARRPRQLARQLRAGSATSHILPLAEPGMVMKGIKSLFAANSPFAIKPRLDPALWSWLRRFAARCNQRDMVAAGRGIQALLLSSLPLYRELIEQEGLDCEFESRGLLFAYRSSPEMDAYAATDRLMTQTFACPARRCDGAELVALEPALRPGLAGGWYYHEDAHLRPDKLMKAWRQVVADRGAVIHENCGFERFQSRNARATAAITPRGELAADLFVVAAGAWTPAFEAGPRLSRSDSAGQRLYSLTMPRPTTCHNIPLIFPETRVAVTPFQSGYRLSSNTSISRRIRRINSARKPRCPQGRIDRLPGRASCDPISEEEWYGWPPMTYDGHHLIIDRSPAYENVFIAAGHNMGGLSIAHIDQASLRRRAGPEDMRRMSTPSPIERTASDLRQRPGTGSRPTRGRVDLLEPFACYYPRFLGNGSGIEQADRLAGNHWRHRRCPAA